MVITRVVQPIINLPLNCTVLAHLHSHYKVPVHLLSNENVCAVQRTFDCNPLHPPIETLSDFC